MNCEWNLTTSDKDEHGLHHIRNRYCEEAGPCFKRDGNGREEQACTRFDKLITGVKICVKK